MNESSDSGLLASREGRVLRLTLNRPDKRNALNLALCRAIVHAVEDGWRDEGVGAILLCGAGKSFCAGMDLSEMLAPEYAAGVTSSLSHVHEQLFTLGLRSPKPILAAVRGAALAGGTGLVANAHIVIAADDSQYGLTEIRIGLWPFVVFRSVCLALGERRAVELALTGRVIGAPEAAALGLVHQVVPAADLDARAAEAAAGAANSSAEAVRSGLLFVAESRGLEWEKGGKIAWEYREQLFRGADFAEGIRAFHDKRAPDWPSTRLP
jgi:enoyl-CoA hydratase/carnithine racemase